jgi:hypothetical protein
MVLGSLESLVMRAEKLAWKKDTDLAYSTFA